ncbi:MAG TPA: PhnD/SsuA/transferrin family substrate-binding protein [Geobacteraceae bacterium]|nr:PhnD/SsuA/transferrin family substrate-binding protein [Geobacteraceae bacterium]
MRLRAKGLGIMLLVLVGVATAGISTAAEIRIGIMQAQAGDARKYQPLLDYLGKKGLPATFVTASTYPAAADMFAKGQVDAMFSGSGVAGALLIKEVAEPLARPVNLDGTSTYSAVVVVKKGAGKFTGSGDYFAGKRVIFTSLASSGEFYYRSLGASKAKEIMQAASHGAALDALSRGQADVAIVKNRVWDKEKAKYPDLEQIGKDKTENPDNSLMVSKKLAGGTSAKLSSILLGLGNDTSDEAKTVKDSLKITKFIKTTHADFKGTLALLKKAGVTKSFAFKY